MIRFAPQNLRNIAAVSSMDKAQNTFWGRPTDVMLMPDGSVLVSDEQMGAIYRVSYKR